MTTYIWTEQCERGCEVYGGETPGAQLEAELIHAFTNDPERVIRAIDHVAKRFAAGKINTSCWAVVRAELRERVQREAVADTAGAQAKAIKAAETWLRNCGPHFRSQTELEDELFGDRGLLRDWADDSALRARMVSAWREQRPRGEQIEREQAEADERWAASHTCERCGNMRPFLMAPCPHCRRVTTTVELGRNEPALGRTPEPVLGGAK